jgi:hypothetical protein
MWKVLSVAKIVLDAINARIHHASLRNRSTQRQGASMSLTKFGFIVIGKGLDLKVHRMEMQFDAFVEMN